MAILFTNIPVPAVDGPGAAVDISTLGRGKAIVCSGTFDACVTIQVALDAGATEWVDLQRFMSGDNQLVRVAAHWMRAVTSDYVSGTPVVTMTANDGGTSFVTLPVAGTPVAAGALAAFKTFYSEAFTGTIDVSDDGVSWEPLVFMGGGGTIDRVVSCQWLRITGAGDDVLVGASFQGAETIAVPTTPYV